MPRAGEETVGSPGMTPLFAREHPGDNEALRAAIYQGTAFHLDPLPASRRLVEAGRALLVDGLGDVCDDVRRAQTLLTPSDFFTRVGTIRRKVYLDSGLHRMLARLLDALGFDLDRVAVDPLRLRVSADRGYENPAAAPVYYAHRDTWYGHPQTLIVGWIPLTDVIEAETFAFLPGWFARAVPNDSEIFDYDETMGKQPGLRIGWQDARAGLVAPYPRVTCSLPAEDRVGFSAREAEVLLFSGSHLHETRRHALG